MPTDERRKRRAKLVWAMPYKEEEDECQPTNEESAEPNSFVLCLTRRRKTNVNPF